MRKYVMMLCLVLGLSASAVKVSVDENVEFVSAMCRIAGFDEYVNNVNKQYVTVLDSVMAPLKDHPAVARLNELRGAQGLSYDAVAALAANTTIQDGHFVLLSGSDLSKLDSRWKSGQDADVARLLDDAYRQSGFHDFYVSQKPFYDKVIANVETMLSNVDLAWLEDFYGAEIRGRLSVSLLNYGNYGVTRQRSGMPDESVIIIGCWKLDGDGIPVFHNTESLIVHEFSHPMCNPIIDDNFSAFNDNAQLVADLMEDELSVQAYSGGSTMLCESMVRSVEIQYALAHAKCDEDSADVETAIKSQVAGGFLVVPEIVNAMTEYRNNRDRYKTLSQAAPLIVAAVNGLDVTQRYCELRRGQITVLGCSLADGTRNVPASDRYAVKVFFDKPVVNNPMACDYYDNNPDIFPDICGAKFDKDRRIMTVYIKTEPGKEYGFKLLGWPFMTDAGYRGRGDAPVHFFTAK